MLRSALAGAAAAVAFGCAHAQDGRPVDFGPLAAVYPQDAAIALALSAAPEHLRADATVYVFTAGGYRKVRDGTNGFTCLNNRDAFFYGASAIKPTCWDAAGADTYVPVMLDVGAAVARGTPPEDIKASVEQDFAEGRYTGPARLGVAYMLAGDVDVDADGRVAAQRFPGHFMFYAPDVSDADMGIDRAADPSSPFIFNAGAGGGQLGYLIVMAGDHAMAR